MTYYYQKKNKKELLKLVKIFIIIGVLFNLFILLTKCHAVDVTIAWAKPSGVDVAGYKIHYGQASRAYDRHIDAGNNNKIKLSGIAEGRNTYFAVTSYDKNKAESEYSIELVCYTLLPFSAGPGTITPASAVMVSASYPVTFTMTPEAGATVSDVVVDNTSVGKKNSYAFVNVTNNHTIKAVFSSGSTVPPSFDALLSLGFDEGSGTVVKDSSGSGNNGIISGATYTTNSAAGAYALSFAGDDAVTIPAKEVLKPSDMTLAFWLKHTVDTTTNYGGIIHGAYGNGYSTGFRVLDWHNTALVQINFGDTDPVELPGKPFINDQWNHIALTYDHKTVSLYLNGVLASAIPETRNINWGTTPSNFIIGLAQWSFTGLLDELLMYNYALTPQQVGQLYVPKGLPPSTIKGLKLQL